MLGLINILFAATLLVGAVVLYLKSYRIKHTIDWAEPEDKKSSLVSVSVPKNNQKTPFAAEQMFAALHGILRPGTENQQQISFEIVSKNKQIVFYIHLPSEIKDFVINQVYAQYPEVEIKELNTETEDYTHLDDQKGIAATELALKRSTAYPIKTFVNFEVDPLSGITGVLSSAGDDEQIWIQTIIQPIDDDWHKLGEAAIKEIKSPSKAVGLGQIIKEEMKTLTMDVLKNIARPQEMAAPKEEKPTEVDGPTQQAIKGIEEKVTKLGFKTNIRILCTANDDHFAQAKLEQVVGAYKQYSAININSFVFKEISNDKEALKLFQARAFGQAEMIFNITELASIYHFPSETVATPTIAWAGAKKGEPPSNLPIVGSLPADELTAFAQTNYRNQIRQFGIKREDRRLHTYIIGKTGTGKSTLMENMVFDDIREGRGVAVVDPHGELIEHILDLIPENRLQDVIYFNPADYNYPLGFNVLENVDSDMKNIIASGVVGIFKKIFGESWGPRLEYILRNAILALLEYPNSTLLGVMRILTDNAYRRQIINEVHDPVIRDFFVNEYEKYDPKFRQEAINPIQNKVGQFLSSSTIRNIVGQPKSTMDIRQIMDEGKILLANLSIGRIGEDNSALLGSMLITKVQLAAMGRTDIAEDKRRDFYLYVDEFQNFATDSFATILSEARKYRLNLVMINQYINQMPETVSNAVFGNVGTMVAFRVGAADAEALKSEFQPVFDVNDLVNQPNRQIYLKMAIDGVTMPAFSAATLPPPKEKFGLKDQVIQSSRANFAVPRADVEEYIADWSAPIDLNAVNGKDIILPSATKPNLDQAEKEPPAEKAMIAEPIKPSIVEESEPKTNLPDDLKVEILKDRFSRNWYAVAGDQLHWPVEQGREQPNSADQLGESQLLARPADQVSPSPTANGRPLASRGEAAEKETDTQPSGGGGSEDLITWEKAEELGLRLQQPNIKKSEVDQAGDYQPIDEL